MEWLYEFQETRYSQHSHDSDKLRTCFHEAEELLADLCCDDVNNRCDYNEEIKLIPGAEEISTWAKRYDLENTLQDKHTCKSIVQILQHLIVAVWRSVICHSHSDNISHNAHNNENFELLWGYDFPQLFFQIQSKIKHIHFWIFFNIIFLMDFIYAVSVLYKSKGL